MSNTTYPNAIDTPTNPTANGTLGAQSHHLIEGLQNDALVQVETKLGTNSGGTVSPTQGQVLVGGSTAGSSTWVSTLTNQSITTSLTDANNKTWIGVNPAGPSAVNYANIGNSTTGNAVTYGNAGTDTNIDNNFTTKGSGKNRDNGSSFLDFRSSFSNFVMSGGIWTQSSGLVGTMTALTLWIAGVEYSAASVASHTFAASSDTYVDYAPGTGLVYTAVANNAASPSLTAGSSRTAKIITNGSAITSIVQTGIDSLANQIYPTSPVGYGNWIPWTPTFTNLSGGTLNYANYRQQGKTVFWRMLYTMSGANVSGSVTFTVPVTAVTSIDSHSVIGSGYASVSSGTFNLINATLTSTTVATLFANTVSGSNVVGSVWSSSVPITWANLSSFAIQGFYEAA